MRQPNRTRGGVRIASLLATSALSGAGVVKHQIHEMYSQNRLTTAHLDLGATYNP